MVIINRCVDVRMTIKIIIQETCWMIFFFNSSIRCVFDFVTTWCLYTSPQPLLVMRKIIMKVGDYNCLDYCCDDEDFGRIG